MRLCRKNFTSSRPGSSSPRAPTGSTLTPRSARLLTAFAPPPGSTVRSRCFRISTGASRDTREISPYTNSSATRSPSTVMVTLGKASIILRSRSTSFKCFVIRYRGNFPIVAVCRIFSRAAAPFIHHAQDGIDGVSRAGKFHLDRDDCERRERVKISAQVHRIFLRSDEASSLAALFELQQVAHILFRVGMMITEECFCGRGNASGPQLQQKILGSRNAAKHHRPRWNILHDNGAPHAPHGLALQRKRFRRSATGQHHSIGSLQTPQWFPPPAHRRNAIRPLTRGHKNKP